jgi:hypothetical protein
MHVLQEISVLCAAKRGRCKINDDERWHKLAGPFARHQDMSVLPRRQVLPPGASYPDWPAQYVSASMTARPE